MSIQTNIRCLAKESMNVWRVCNGGSGVWVAFLHTNHVWLYPTSAQHAAIAAAIVAVILQQNCFSYRLLVFILFAQLHCF